MIKDKNTAYGQQKQRELDQGERYFSFTERETIVPLGRFTHTLEAIDASDEIGVASVWVFSEEGLRTLMASCEEALK